jgi:alpha-amylase/alpha-mannosidase (GH57 family)
MEKYICIHGHFYQPPRENAWLEEIEIQESAYPYHDWNERITEECYGPNAFSRILDDNSKIVDITNNYARMSYNFGPTLLSWIELKKPRIYKAIIESDKISQELFNGHGSALAQVYNHIIMPLANYRDKQTQVIWGIKDFEHRFNRKPEGMWLAETAVDTETLEVLAENHIKFTILAPRQAKAMRKIGDNDWTPGCDPRRPYRINLPSGKFIDVFFYDGERSQAVAFKGLLKDGKDFANELLSGFNNNSNEAQLVHIATDGESYGHHHRYGDMALAYCIRYIEENTSVKITNYSQYLALYPPTYEAQIHENSSWSCVHGVERWRSNCGCNSGGNPGWHQQWRQPLRESLDWLRDITADIFENQMLAYHPSPWSLRDNYVDVLLRKRTFFQRDFIAKYVNKDLTNKEDLIKIVRLLEMQKNALYMYTSCGWFFDELSGIETIQILQYANRVIHLAENLTGYNLEDEFVKRLQPALSNKPELGNGRGVYDKYVAPTRLSLTQVGMHYAINSLFNDDIENIEVLNYSVDSSRVEKYTQGGQKLAFGKTKVQSQITLSEKNFSFIIIYLGQHHLIGKAFDDLNDETFDYLANQVKKHFLESNLAAILDTFKDYAEHKNFSFFNLFKDEQIKMLEKVLDENQELASSSYKKINERTYNMINVMRANNLPIPFLLSKNLQITIANELRETLHPKMEKLRVGKIKGLLDEIKKWDINIDKAQIAYSAGNLISRFISTKKDKPDEAKYYLKIKDTLKYLAQAGIHPPLSEMQERIFVRLQDCHATNNNPELLDALTQLGEQLNLDIQSVYRCAVPQ